MNMHMTSIDIIMPQWEPDDDNKLCWFNCLYKAQTPWKFIHLYQAII